MADIIKTVEIIFSGQDKTSAAISNIQTNLGDLTNSADKSKGALKGTTDELSKIEKTDLTSATAALKAFAASLVLKEFIDANSQLDTFRATLTLATGDLQTTNKLIDDLRGFANKVGIEFSVIAPSFSAFLSAAKGTAIEGQPAVEIFEAFGTALAAAGVNSTNAAGAFTQLSQGVSKGKFELDDLKSIAEQLPGFFSQFAAALGVSVPELYKLITAGQIGIPEIQKLAQQFKITFVETKFDTFNAELARLRDSIKLFYTTVGDAGSFDLLKKGIEALAIPVAGATAAINLFGTALGIVAGAIATRNFTLVGTEIDAAIAKASKSVDGLVPKFLGLDQATKDSTTTLKDNIIALDGVDMAMIDLAKSLDKTSTETDKAKTKVSDISKEFDRQARLALDAEKAANDYEVKMAQIASNQQIKLIEADVKLQIAEAQANAQIITGVFNDLQETFNDTGSVISNIFGNLGDIGGFFGLEKLELIEDQLEKENQYRSDALQLQKDLTAATINNLNAKAQALQAGNALIQIDGAGLQPHLEAFMWEILKTIQVRVNEDGLEMLVGV